MALKIIRTEHLPTLTEARERCAELERWREQQKFTTPHFVSLYRGHRDYVAVVQEYQDA